MGEKLSDGFDNNLNDELKMMPNVAGDGEQTGAAVSPVTLANLDGQQVGRYRVGRLIGSGGVAMVYQAYDGVQGMPVALKVLLPHADEKTYSRFRREALTAGGLRHEHIVRILQVGTMAQGGIAYMAMELVEGETLSELLNSRGALSPQESCNLLEPIARALHFAHQAGVVHRDVKPSNILLRTVSPGAPNSIQLESLDHPVVPLLSDFGVARFLDAPELTSTGRTVGTPAYMAPEQCAGKRDVDGRADIYALGTVLYRCVTGRLPFSGSVTQILHAHVYEPLTIDTDVLHRLSPALVEILRCSLAKNPDDRYATIGEMAGALALAAGRTPPRPQAKEAEATATLTLSTAPPRPSVTPTSTTVLVPGSTTPTSNPTVFRPTSNPLKTRTVTTPRPASVVQLAEPTVHREERVYRFTWALLPIALAVLIFAVAVALVNSPFGLGRDPGAGGDVTTLPSPTSEQAIVNPNLPPTMTNTPAPIDTNTPLAPTAMLDAATTVAPAATWTPTPTPLSLTATPTVTPLPSATPTPTPTWTMLPTATLTPTATITPTATATPAATTCPISIDMVFADLLTPNEQARFGCPEAAAIQVEAELLGFENGFMLRLNDRPGLIYISYSDGSWEAAESVWQEGEPETPDAPPPPGGDRFVPPRAFGKLWQQRGLQNELGYARFAEPSFFPGLKQPFAGGGILVAAPDGGQYFAFPSDRRQ